MKKVIPSFGAGLLAALLLVLSPGCKNKVGNNQQTDQDDADTTDSDGDTDPPSQGPWLDERISVRPTVAVPMEVYRIERGTGSRIVFDGLDDQVNGSELFALDDNGMNLSTLTTEMSAGTNVRYFGVASSGRVVFVAGTGEDHEDELYAVDQDGGNRVKLSQAGDLGAYIIAMSLAPDGSKVAFTSDYDLNGTHEVFIASLAGGTPVKASGALVTGGSVRVPTNAYPQVPRPAINASSTHVVFVADAEVDNRYELFATPLAGGAPTKLNAALPAGASVGVAATDTAFSFATTPDGNRVIYAADQDTLGQKELYAVDLDGGNRVKLSAAMIAAGDLDLPAYQAYSLCLSPDSQWVAYFADGETDNKSELFAARVDGSAVTKISGGHEASNWRGCRFSPDSSLIVFTTEADEVFVVTPGGTGLTQIDDAGTAESIAGYEGGPHFTPDGDRVIYIDQLNDVNHMPSVTTDGASRVDLLASLATPGAVSFDSVRYSPDGSRLAATIERAPNDFAIIVANVDGTSTVVAEQDLGTAREVTFTSDGSRLLFTGHADGLPVGGPARFYSAAADGSLRVDLADLLPTHDAWEVGNGAWVSRDGGLIGYSVLTPTLDVWDLRVTRFPSRTDVPLPGDLALQGMMGSFYWDPVFLGENMLTRYRSPEGSWSSYLTNLTTGARQLVGAAGGSGFCDANTFGPSPDNGRFLFSACIDGTPAELYVINADGSGQTKLNPPMVVNGGVRSLQDGARFVDANTVVYLAFGDSADSLELYGVDANGQNPRKLNGPLVTGGDVLETYFASATSGRVVYAAKQDSNTFVELYSARVDGTGKVKLSGAISGTGYGINQYAAASYALSPDGSKAAYVASLSNSAQGDLYVVGTDGTGHALRNPPGVNMGGRLLQFSSDGEWIAAEGRASGRDELYAVRVDGSAWVQLSEPTRENPYVDHYSARWLPGTQVFAYRTQMIIGQHTLRLVNADGSNRRPAVVQEALEDVTTFRFSSDGQTLLVLADLDINEVFELFAVPVAGGPPRKVHHDLPFGRGIQAFDFFPTNDRVWLATDPLTRGVRELFVFPVE